MSIAPLNIKTSSPCVVGEGMSGRMCLGRRNLPLKQTVIWALTRVANRVVTRIEGQRITLAVVDYLGRELHAGSKMITLRLMNEDIKEMVLAEDCLCPAAREWLEKIGERLLLKIEGYRPNEPLLSQIVNLYAGVEAPENRAYGILLIGRRL